MGLFGKKNKSLGKQDLLALQKLLDPNSPDKLVYSKADLLKKANSLAGLWLSEIQSLSTRLQNVRGSGELDFCLEQFEETAEKLVLLEPYVKFDNGSPSQILESFRAEKPKLIQDFEARPNVRYYENMDNIEMQWSVLSNLKIFTGAQADAFEAACRENINDYLDMVHEAEQFSPRYERPPHVPAYTRLAMLYEKQGRYADAVNVCAESIRNGAVADGSKGKMYGRLARMISKAGADVSPDILQLLDHQA